MDDGFDQFKGELQSSSTVGVAKRESRLRNRPRKYANESPAAGGWSVANGNAIRSDSGKPADRAREKIEAAEALVDEL